MNAIDNIYPYAQCDRDDERTIIGLQQAEDAAEMEAREEVNFYTDENTGELITLCRYHAEIAGDVRLVCGANESDTCGECDVEMQYYTDWEKRSKTK